MQRTLILGLYADDRADLELQANELTRYVRWELYSPNAPAKGHVLVTFYRW
jgi:hypothetical protein